MENDEIEDEIFVGIREEIFLFRRSVLESLDDFTVKSILKKINPYLLSAITSLEGIFRYYIDANLVASMESKFGRTFEQIALLVCGQAAKSGITGVDLELIKNGRKLLISNKSGSSWGNSQSTAKQSDSFKTAKKVIRQNSIQEVISVMGICYGKRKTSSVSCADIQIMGQNYWYLLSGDKEFYKKIIEVISCGSAEFRKELDEKKQIVSNRLLDEFRVLVGENDVWSYLAEECCGNYSEKEIWLQNIME